MRDPSWLARIRLALEVLGLESVELAGVDVSLFSLDFLALGWSIDLLSLEEVVELARRRRAHQVIASDPSFTGRLADLSWAADLDTVRDILVWHEASAAAELVTERLWRYVVLSTVLPGVQAGELRESDIGSLLTSWGTDGSLLDSQVVPVFHGFSAKRRQAQLVEWLSDFIEAEESVLGIPAS